MNHDERELEMQPNITYEVATARIAELQRFAAERSAAREIRPERGRRLSLGGLRRYVGRARGGRRTLVRRAA
jgi:hypothetical protein